MVLNGVVTWCLYSKGDGIASVGKWRREFRARRYVKRESIGLQRSRENRAREGGLALGRCACGGRGGRASREHASCAEPSG